MPLLTPAIIIGGIVSGAFRPIEAAIAAVMYTIFLGAGLYRSLSYQSILAAAFQTVCTMASVLMIVASAALFAWVLTADQAGEVLVSYLLYSSSDPTIVLLLVVGVLNLAPMASPSGLPLSKKGLEQTGLSGGILGFERRYSGLNPEKTL